MVNFMSDKITYKHNPTGHSNPIGTRLKLEMRKLELTSAELARRANVLTSFIYDIISGKSSNPSIVKLARVADAMGINLAYLVHGGVHNGVHAGAENSKPITNGAARENYIAIPRIILSNHTDAGKNILSYKEDNEPCYFDRKLILSYPDVEAANLRMLTISGDSMEPTICNQDVVVIDTGNRSPSPPSIFVLFDGFGLSAKRLEYVFESKNPCVRIISDNQRYSTYELPMSDVTIIGRIVWFSRAI
jgi:transcriptional regulator with XRE-family HTH domain